MSRKFTVQKSEKTDFTSYSYLLNGVAGIGKTTLAHEVGKSFGEEGGFLITVGQEPEPVHLHSVFGARAPEWRDLEDIISELTRNRKAYPDTKVVVIDTVDEVFRLAEAEVIRQYNLSVNMDKQVTSIKQAYGGFQAGENKVVDIVVETIFKLRDVGYSLFFLGHTKTKGNVDQITEIEYELLTSNLTNKYYNTIKDKVNIVATAYIERTLTDVETVRDAFSKGNKQVGRVEGEKRVITFRDEEYAIDVKSHLKFIAPKISFGTEEFIKAIEDAIDKDYEHQTSKTKERAKNEPKKTKKDSKKEEPVVTEEKPEPREEEKATDRDEIDIESNEEMIKKIKDNISNVDMAKVKEITDKYGFKDFSDPAIIPTIALEEVVKLI